MYKRQRNKKPGSLGKKLPGQVATTSWVDATGLADWREEGRQPNRRPEMAFMVANTRLADAIRKGGGSTLSKVGCASQSYFYDAALYFIECVNAEPPSRENRHVLKRKSGFFRQKLNSICNISSINLI